jgi:molybdenum cofactor guanylyltransferase
MPTALSDVTLAMIAGGFGRRMGIAKARLSINHQSILAWQLQRLNWHGPTMVVTSPSTLNPPDAEMFDQECIDPEDGAGPLRGILTALENSRTPLVAAIALDMPCVQRFMLKWLVGAFEQIANLDGLMCRVPEGDKFWIEPFPSVFRTNAVPAIRRLMAIGERSVRGLCDASGFQAIDVPGDWNEDVWTNLNEPGQLEVFLEKLGSQSQDNIP